MKELKILLIGLDNAGKSSILLSLQKNTNVLTYCSMKPTVKVNVVELEEESPNIHIWDFGGQEQYREDYLKDFEKYLTDVDKIIFVIDIQAVKRYEEALSYIKAIIDELKKGKISFETSVFLHKYDPNLEQDEYFMNIAEIIEEKLIKPLNQIIPTEFNHKFYDTTIFSVFEKTSLML